MRSHQMILRVIEGKLDFSKKLFQNVACQFPLPLGEGSGEGETAKKRCPHPGPLPRGEGELRF